VNIKAIKNFYWITFGLSVIVLVLNFGLGLLGLGIIILPVLILHFTVELSLHRIKNSSLLIVISACNLLAFALIRPDGVHTTTDNGLSSLLDIFVISGGFDSSYENHYFIASLILLIVQIVFDLTLKFKKAKTIEAS
jgi:hypothetical protein